MNPRITKKEMGLLKGAIRRVFSRSTLRQEALLKVIIKEHHDISRPRVKKWGACLACKQPTPLYLMQVDHVSPVIPVDKSLDTMSWDELIDRIWCDLSNLEPLCPDCHYAKSSLESKERRKNKNEQSTQRLKKTTKKRSTRNSTRVVKKRVVRRHSN